MNKTAKLLYDILSGKVRKHNMPMSRFYMGAWIHDCGTPACIGGHAQVLLGMPNARWQRVAEGLGLHKDIADALFFPLISDLDAKRNKIVRQLYGPTAAEDLPIQYIGSRGAKLAAEALKRAVKLSQPKPSKKK